MWKARVAALGAASLVALTMSAGAGAHAHGDSNKGDVWLDNAGQPPGPGHEMDPHLRCDDINLWGDKMADPSGTFTIDVEGADIRTVLRAIAEFSGRNIVVAPDVKGSVRIALRNVGWQAGEARLVDVQDALAADDVRPFVLEVRPPPTYALITRQPAELRPSASYFLERALVPAGRGADDVHPAHGLAQRLPQDFPAMTVGDHVVPLPEALKLL